MQPFEQNVHVLDYSKYNLYDFFFYFQQVDIKSLPFLYRVIPRAQQSEHSTLRLSSFDHCAQDYIFYGFPSDVLQQLNSL